MSASNVYLLVVMFPVPVAMVGGFLVLALTMTSLSIYRMPGLIMSVGLVIKNAILIAKHKRCFISMFQLPENFPTGPPLTIDTLRTGHNAITNSPTFCDTK